MSHRQFQHSRLSLLAACAILALPTTASSQDTRTGTTQTSTRISSTTRSSILPPWEPNLATLTAPPEPFIIPGGGDVLKTPLWFKLTKIIADLTTEDGSPDDEVYAVIGVVVLNKDKLWESKVFTTGTNIYKGMSDGDFRAVNYSLLSKEGSEIAIPSAGDVIIRISLYEYDGGGTPDYIAAMAHANMLQVVSGLHPGITYGQIYQKIADAFYRAVFPNASLVGDDVIGGYVTQGIFLSDDDLAAARRGAVMKKTKIFVSSVGDEVGKYTLRFQLGRQGVETVVW